MKAELLIRRRVHLADDAFVELVGWQLPAPLAGSPHRFKYRFAYVVNEVCELRYDNEAGKGDHMHVGTKELPYAFSTIDQLVKDFLGHVERMRS